MPCHQSLVIIVVELTNGHVLVLIDDLVHVIQWTHLTVTIHVVHALMVLRLIVRLLRHHILLLNNSHHGSRRIIKSLLIDHQVRCDHVAISSRCHILELIDRVLPQIARKSAILLIGNGLAMHHGAVIKKLAVFETHTGASIDIGIVDGLIGPAKGVLCR